MHFYPVHPTRAPSTRPGSRASKVSLQETDPYSGLSVSCYNFTLETMLDLQFASFNETKGYSNVQYFLLEMTAYTPELTQVLFEAERGQITFERHGVGLRIGIASWDVGFSTASNVVAVAAAASVKSAKTMMSVQTFGGDALDNLKYVRDLKLLAGLDADAMRLIAGAAGEVADKFKEGGLETTVLHAASLGVGIPTRQAAAMSMQFVNERIYRGDSLLEALAGSLKDGSSIEKENLNPLICRAGYLGYGLRYESDTPDDARKDEAHTILTLGR
jgi:hypothetical protein